MPSQPIAFCEDFCLSPAHLIQAKQHPDPNRDPAAKFSTTHAPFHASSDPNPWSKIPQIRIHAIKSSCGLDNTLVVSLIAQN
jgi:hypothetical protein